jgi:hypothetical protein
MRARLLVAMLAVVCLSGMAWAAPLDMKQVGADAKWLAHLDVDAIRAATMSQKIHDFIMEKHPDAAEHLEQFKAVWHFSPCDDLHGLTIWGAQMKHETGVLIVHAKVDRAFLEGKARQAPEHAETTYGKYTIHSWRDKHPMGPHNGRMVSGVFAKDDVVIFGKLDEVKAALDVFDGAKPNLAGKDSFLATAVPAGATLLARVTGIAEVDLPCKSPVVKKIESLAMAMGEKDGQSFVQAKAVVKDTETAEQIKTIVEGFGAMAKMMHGNDPEAMKLLNAAKLTVDGTALTLTWSAPVDEVWQHLKKAAEMHKAHMKEWRQHGKAKECPAEEK